MSKPYRIYNTTTENPYGAPYLAADSFATLDGAMKVAKNVVLDGLRSFIAVRNEEGHLDYILPVAPYPFGAVTSISQPNIVCDEPTQQAVTNFLDEMDVSA